MDWSNIAIAIFTGIGTVIGIYGLFRYKFEKIDLRTVYIPTEAVIPILEANPNIRK